MLTFSVILVTTIVLLSYFAFESVKKAVIEMEHGEMKGLAEIKGNQIETLHARASEDLIFALKNPLFVEYFELPETMAGNEYKDGVLQFTDRQKQIKRELEEWIYYFQNKFDVDETCIIDTTGQEHARLVLTRIEVDENLSPDEEFAPFFEPTFARQADTVHIQYPYVSPDTNRWVFSYSSPVMLGDNQKPAIFHFEMPIAIFQEIISHDHGRVYVVDPKGFIVADSSENSIANARYNVSPETISDYVPEDYFPDTSSISNAPEFVKLVTGMEDEGIGTYAEQGKVYHAAYKRLPNFDWILVVEEDEETMLAESAEIPNLLSQIVFTGIVSVGVGVTVIIMISNRLSAPLQQLNQATKRIADGDLHTTIHTGGSDEIHDLSESFASMAKSLKKTIELERNLAKAQEDIKNEKLASIGTLASRMAHDIKNPLAIISGAATYLKKHQTFDEKYLEYIERLKRATSRIDHQITNVLDFVKTREPRLTEATIESIIDNVFNNLDLPAGVRIQKTGDDCKIRCDPTLLEVVFVNIIINAIQAMDDNGSIKIRVTDKIDTVMIEVENDGPPIPNEALPHIFEPLFTTKMIGTGLGLASCSTIVKQHGGTIHAYNNPTRFVIEIPKLS